VQFTILLLHERQRSRLTDWWLAMTLLPLGQPSGNDPATLRYMLSPTA
jgi:hypothetical protein